MAGSTALSVAAGDIAVAARDDDAELRRLLRESVMPGAIRVALTREPDYFAADGMAGADDVTLVSRQDGRIVGMGRLSVFRLMRNGVSRRIGYLGALRITSGTREAAQMLREGYELLAQNVPGPVDGCFTSIASDNVRARRVLEHGARFGLPAYRPLCDLVTLIAPVAGQPSRHEPPDDAELLEFLEHESARAQLSLGWSRERLEDLDNHGIAATDFSVVRHDGAIAGTAAVWDQRAFRQVVIDGYSDGLGAARPLLNAFQALVRGPALPPPGTVLAQGALLGAFVRSPDDWAALWPALLTGAVKKGLSWLSISRDARDPELAVLRRVTKAREYRTTLYEVEWRHGPRWPDAWDDRLFRPEVGLL